MKRKRHGKEVGMIILVALIVLSLAEVAFRAATMGLEARNTANFGEQLAIIALAVIILILTAKGKDRACYILYGAWISYFALDQVFELPGSIATSVSMMGTSIGGDIALMLRIGSMVTIIALAVILWEYMIDKTIYNKVFNILSIATVLMILGSIGIELSRLIVGGYRLNGVLLVFNHNLRLTMVFLMACFAYDSAKLQLEKTKLSK